MIYNSISISFFILVSRFSGGTNLVISTLRVKLLKEQNKTVKAFCLKTTIKTPK